MTATKAPDHGETVAEPVAGPRSDRGRAGDVVVAVCMYLLAQAAFLVGLRTLVPRFFWLDDQQAQYVPAFSWLGRTAEGGRPPLLDPDLGGGGNFLADPQYGVLDPTHWLISRLVSSQDSVLEAAWLLGCAAVLVLGLGLVLLLSAYRVRPALAAAAAVGAASTGLFLWVGGSWWPVMWGTSWLPWLWLGLVLRRWPGVVVTALAAWQLTASGYPYVLIPAGLLVAGHLVELHRRRTEAGTPGLREVLARLLAGAAGLVAGAPGLIASQELAGASTRSTPPDSPVNNVGAMIPNLLDALVGGNTLTPSVSGAAGGFLWLPPLAATAVFALPALVLVRWRAAVRAPGVLTALVLWGAALVLTQMPTDVASLRYPFRYLAVTGPALAVLAAVALTVAPVVTRRRLALAAGVVGGQFVLSILRGPALWGWHLLAAVLGIAAVAAVAALVGRPGNGSALRAPWAGRAAAAVLVFLAVAADLLPVGSTTSAFARQETQAEAPLSGLPARQMVQRTDWGVTVEQFRARSVAVDTSLTVLVFGGFADLDRQQDQGWAWGVLPGNANLLAGLRPGFGYVAVGHGAWTERLCQDLFGQMDGRPECVEGLLEDVPGTDLSWIDAMASDEVLLSPYAPEAIREHFADTWTEAGLAGVHGRFTRDDELPGRVTWASDGVDVGAAGDDAARAFGSGRPGESLLVSTPDDGGELVLRIPAWPGFRAEVDGRTTPVGSVEDTLLTVHLPGGLEGARLDLYYEPTAARLVVPAAVGGAVLLVVALVVGGLAGVRRRRSA